MPVRIQPGGLDDSRVIALLELHLTRAREVTPVGSAHALDLSGLKEPSVTFWSVWDDETLAGVCALKELTPKHGEVESMHTAESMRRRGVAGAMLRHIVDVARSRGMTRLSLETGNTPYFAAARKLYRREGFTECGPYGDYREDPNSVFVSMDLT